MNPTVKPKHPGIAERLEAFIAEKADNPRQFALAAGLTPQVISHLLQGKAVPSGDTLTALVTKWPTLNTTWLLTGNGGMYVGGTPAAVAALGRPSGDATTRLSIAHPTREEFAQLQEENRKLREQLAKQAGKLEVVEEDRQWLRSQVGGKAEASADATTDNEPGPTMEAVRNYDYVEAAPVAMPRRAVGFQFGS